MLAAAKMKISGSEEKKSKQEHVVRHIKTTAKKCTKKCASRAKLFFFLIRLIVFFFALLVAVAFSGDVTRADRGWAVKRARPSKKV